MGAFPEFFTYTLQFIFFLIPTFILSLFISLILKKFQKSETLGNIFMYISYWGSIAIFTTIAYFILYLNFSDFLNFGNSDLSAFWFVIFGVILPIGIIYLIKYLHNRYSSDTILENERSPIISLICALIILGILIDIISLLYSLLTWNFVIWDVIYTIISIIAYVVAVIYLRKMKKWALYYVTILVSIALIIALTIGRVNSLDYIISAVIIGIMWTQYSKFSD
jgi:hypothetical protein